MLRRMCLLMTVFMLLACISGCTKRGPVNSGNLSTIDKYPDVSISGTQTIDINTYSLRIDGLVKTPMNFTYQQILQKTPQTKVIDLICVIGPSARLKWEGIPLKELFADVTVKSEANTVIFYSSDGFTTSLPLKYIMDNDIMIAYKVNDLVLTPQRGFPFQVAAEGKYGYKWAKWLTRIELSGNSGYLGYWEQRGYSNEADIYN